MRPQRIIFSTSNSGKMREVREALEPLGIEVVRMNLGYVEVQTSSLEEVARVGMQELIRRGEVKEPTLIDDSGLFIDALGGFPGVYSAYALGTIGYRGLLRLMEGEANRAAYFDACLSYYDPAIPEPVYFHGTCKGVIGNNAAEGGVEGFGFDPIFHPLAGQTGEKVPDPEKPLERSFSQIPTAEKNHYSHRGKAVAALVEWLASGE